VPDLTTRAGPTLVVRPERITLLLGVVVAALVAGHVAAAVIDRAVGHDVFAGSEALVRLFIMDGENNFPTWYSASALLGCAALALSISRARPAGPGGFRRHWAGLAAVLTFLSADEAAVIHEELSDPVTEQIGLDPNNWEYWAWVLPYTALAIALVIVFWPFFRRLPALTRRLFVVAGGLFMAGAAGLELVGSRLYEEQDLSAGYLTVVGFEETTEMAAVVVLVYALLRYLQDQVGPVRLAWSEHG
jgi:hypothetical protein